MALLARFDFLVLCWSLCTHLCQRPHLSGALACSLPMNVNNPSCECGKAGEFPQCVVSSKCRGLMALQQSGKEREAKVWAFLLTFTAVRTTKGQRKKNLLT